VRLSNGKWECAHCGTVLDVPDDQVPMVVIHAASGKPNERVLSLDGRELHRCVVEDARRAIAHD
jgi:hypothetical protein